MKPNQAKSDEPVDDDNFWLIASEVSLNPIWDNSEDDIYAELLGSEDYPEKL